MNSKKFVVTIGIILAVAFFASLIAAMSSEEENENKQRSKTEKEYNCPDKHTGNYSKEGCKCCCKPGYCREMKCDTSMCKQMREMCATAERKCNPSECPHHVDKCVKGEKMSKEDCAMHADKSKAEENKCDPKTCTGKCPSKAKAKK